MIERIIGNPKKFDIKLRLIHLRFFMGNKKHFLRLSLIIATSSIALGGLYLKFHNGSSSKASFQNSRVYWFIPDGLRADPDVFKVFEWAQNGELSTIKRMMEEGSFGYSIPTFPGHSATNFAVLLTGTYPEINGVADGAMHIDGYPLEMVSKGGFSSSAKKISSLWSTLEEQGKRVALVSVPGSTPPEISNGVTVKGRWGGWGADFPSVIFQSLDAQDVRVKQGFDNRVFGFGVELSKYLSASEPKQWEVVLPKSYSPALEIMLENFGQVWYGLLLDTKNDGETSYDKILISRDKKEITAQLTEGEWSSWLPITLLWETQNDYNHFTPKKMKWERSLSALPVETKVKIKAIKLGKPGFFRIRFLYDQLNELVVDPTFYTASFKNALGPMVDYVDNYPPQLIYFDEDKKTFIEEMNESLEWHTKAASYFTQNKDFDFIIHDTYTPNQMLTSRWWMNAVDPKGREYATLAQDERQRRLEEVKGMYKKIDKLLEAAWKNLGANDYIILSSDHGAIPLHTEVLLNNLFAKEGWLKISYNKKTGEHQIDWKNSKVIFLKMDAIYINPKGLEGNYAPAKGKEYEELRAKVINLLKTLKSGEESVVSGLITREEASKWHLPQDRVGDLIVANSPGYNFVENVSEDYKLFTPSIIAGYKQGVLAQNEKGMWTPFIIVGPGVKKGFKISTPIQHVDQHPTILKLLKIPLPAVTQGKVLQDILAE